MTGAPGLIVHVNGWPGLRKLADVSAPEALRARHCLLRTEADIRIGMDVTGIAAGQDAAAIAARLGWQAHASEDTFTPSSQTGFSVGMAPVGSWPA